MKTIITFEITQAARHCGLTSEDIMEFIAFEWVQPLDAENLLLDEADLVRIQLIAELKGQLGVNNESVPIILHLIDQLNHLHRELL